MLNSEESSDRGAQDISNATEARQQREINDLVITTNSLLKVNSKLERTLKTQAARINELCKDSSTDIAYDRVCHQIQGIIDIDFINEDLILSAQTALNHNVHKSCVNVVQSNANIDGEREAIRKAPSTQALSSSSFEKRLKIFAPLTPTNKVYRQCCISGFKVPLHHILLPHPAPLNHIIHMQEQIREPGRKISQKLMRDMSKCVLQLSRQILIMMFLIPKCS
jgi:hypothetical protein